MLFNCLRTVFRLLVLIYGLFAVLLIWLYVTLFTFCDGWYCGWVVFLLGCFCFCLRLFVVPVGCYDARLFVAGLFNVLDAV